MREEHRKNLEYLAGKTKLEDSLLFEMASEDFREQLKDIFKQDEVQLLKGNRVLEEGDPSRIDWESYMNDEGDLKDIYDVRYS